MSRSSALSWASFGVSSMVVVAGCVAIFLIWRGRWMSKVSSEIPGFLLDMRILKRDRCNALGTINVIGRVLEMRRGEKGMETSVSQIVSQIKH